MSLKKAIKSGKEKRKPISGWRALDSVESKKTLQFKKSKTEEQSKQKLESYLIENTNPSDNE